MNQWQDRSEILFTDKRYSLFLSGNKNIFNYTNKISKYGAIDFWETGIARPDLLIKELAIILYPNLFKGEKLIWFKKL